MALSSFLSCFHFFNGFITFVNSFLSQCEPFSLLLISLLLAYAIRCFLKHYEYRRKIGASDGVADLNNTQSCGTPNQCSDKMPSIREFPGIPNTTTKYSEDKRVIWHSTPFETRLQKALKELNGDTSLKNDLL
ncbi:hypothetical protein RIF29_08172 [Crotalaria pallida]|uniref:Uncharacterized protein n=1 Tax=Crotalaria pallida TaxID=3830 RepID=A0AAN9J5Z6_CROPI